MPNFRRGHKGSEFEELSRQLLFVYRKPQENFHQYLQPQTLLKLVTVEHKDLVMIARKFEIPQTKSNQNID